MNLPLTLNGVPLIPGAWMINSNIHTPIYSSIPDMHIFGFQDGDDYWYVLPGYKVIVWSSVSYTSDSSKTSKICDNTTGTQIVTYTIPTLNINSASSCQLFYNNVEIRPVYNQTFLTPTNGTT
jgi:hypothetical protein